MFDEDDRMMLTDTRSDGSETMTTPPYSPTLDGESMADEGELDARLAPGNPEETFGRLREAVTKWRTLCDNATWSDEQGNHEAAAAARQLAQESWDEAVEANSHLPDSMRHPVLTELGARILSDGWEYPPLRPGENMEDRGLSYYTRVELVNELMSEIRVYEQLTADGWHESRRLRGETHLSDLCASLIVINEGQLGLLKRFGFDRKGSKNHSGTPALGPKEILEDELGELTDALRGAFAKAEEQSKRRSALSAEESLNNINAWGSALGLDWAVTGSTALYMSRLSEPARPSNQCQPLSAEIREALCLRHTRHFGSEKRLVDDEKEPQELVLGYLKRQ